MNGTRWRRHLIVSFLVLLSQRPGAVAADWPHYRHDGLRSGRTAEQLHLPLELAWTRHTAHPPQPAWPGPAEQDYFNRRFALHPQDAADLAFQPVIAGGRVYYGSSASDTLTCADLTTGEAVWTQVTEGPLRLAPAIVGGRVYAGSDDGLLYCWQADIGRLLWTYRAGPEDQRLPGNERMISRWPIRGGLVADAGVLHFTAGVFPSAGVYLCAIELETVREVWKREIDIPARGYLAASPTRIYVPSGRTGYPSLSAHGWVSRRRGRGRRGVCLARGRRTGHRSQRKGSDLGT